MPTPVISVAQMREWEEATWAMGQSEESVMRKAGQAVARAALRMTLPGAEILVLAGKGNNGGDARYAAEYLPDRRVQRVDVADADSAAKDVSQWPGESNRDRSSSLIIDGLFGIGLNRPLESGWLQLVEQMNQSGVPILAIDVPSGLNADTGEPMGAAVRADATVTFGAMKSGLIRSTATPFVGRLEVAAEIGLLECPFDSELNWTLPDDFSGFPVPRPVEGHKGTFGHLVIIAGSRGFHGAAVLAARGALRAMPGLVSVFTTEQAYPAVAAQLQQPMVHSWNPESELPPSASAILLGPGLAGRDLTDALIDTARILWLESPLPIIADASALDWLPLGKTPDGAIRIITPHPGEAKRMLARADVEGATSRSEVLHGISHAWGGCRVVLKGRHTLVGYDRDKIYLNSSGNSGLAQGGSGDVLAGYLAGSVAQPRLQDDLDTTIRHAVWEHGHAADVLAARLKTWEIEDLLRQLGNSTLTGAEGSPH